jgi:integrase
MRRRFQKGCFVTEAGSYYVMYYADDGNGGTKRVKRTLGRCSEISERAARRTLAECMDQVNRERGSLAPVVKGETFAVAADKWKQAIAPNLSPSTVRAMSSHLRAHILPRFGRAGLQEMGVGELQQFATDLRKIISRRTAMHVIETVFAVTNYAKRIGVKVNKVEFADLEFGMKQRTDRPFVTREQARAIIEAAPEPYKTLFTIAWFTGLRSGELLALTVADLDFETKTINVDKACDDSTREIRQPKTRASVAKLPMPTGLESTLKAYLLDHWKQNQNGILFPDKTGTRPRSRLNVVRNGLHPVLRKLGIATAHTGLHAWRHGLATALVESSAPISVLQKQMRHADIATSLRVYTHAVAQSQRDAMENSSLQLVRNGQ